MQMHRMAYSMVKDFGMNERVGQLSFPEEGGGQSLVARQLLSNY